MTEPIKVGLAGFGKHSWQSVDKTRQFFLDALQGSFALEYVEDNNFQGDVILNFSSKSWWQPRENLFPVINCVHGGATIDFEFLQTNLPHLYASDGLIVNCESDEEIFNTYCKIPPRLNLLPLPVDHSTFQPKQDYKALENLIGKDDLVLGFFARLLPQKNLHGFLHLFQQLKNQFSSLKAVVVGNYWLDYPLFNWNGEQYPKYIENLINGHGMGNDIKYFTANLQSSDLALLMSRCDLVVHPTLSVDENFGYVVPEALSCGTPVIGSAYGGLKDTLTNDGVGFVMPTWTTQSGSRVDLNSGWQKCFQYLSNEGLRTTQGQGAAKYGQRQFNVDLFKTRLTAIIKSTVKAFRKAYNRPQLVSLNQLPPTNETETFLPKTKGVSWADIQGLVKCYTSENLDTLELEGLMVYPSAQFKAIGAKSIERMDPLWPAKFQLSDQELTLINKVVALGYLKLKHPFPLPEAALLDLIKTGVLNFTYENIFYHHRT